MIKPIVTRALTATAAAAFIATAAPALAATAFDPGQTLASAAASEVTWHQYAQNGRYDDRSYRDRRGRGYNEEPVYRNTRTWRGRDGRYYCKRKNGTTGLLIGGAAGALIGNQVDGGNNRLLGTVLGGVGGALLGREVDRGNEPRRCR